MPQALVLKILLVEDNPGDARLTRELLSEVTRPRFEFAHVERLDEAFKQVDATVFDAALVDLSLPDTRGIETVIGLRDRAPYLPIVVLSGLADEKTAVEALAKGAQDYLVKGQGDGLLMSRALRYAIERKRIQQQLLEEKERAEYANRAKTEFLANMSHELRTPLNAIIGFSEIITGESFGPMGNRAYKEYAQHIYESGTHLLEIINDLLDLSRIEAGRVSLSESGVDVAKAISTSLRVIADRAQAGKVSLEIDVHAALPLLWCDERMLKQILLNMLSNAVKFTPAGGKVNIKAALAENADSGITLTIADTGIGIAEADIPRAMTPFLQVENHLSRRFPGTGLGLPLTKSLVELHGGRLTLESELGVGTTITIAFGPERLLERNAPVKAQASAD